MPKISSRPDLTTERALRELIAGCIHDPLRYVQLVYPWGDPNGPLADHPGPDEWQTEMLLEIGEWSKSGAPISGRWSRATGHGVGKSALSAWLIMWFTDTRPNCAGVVTANTQAQLKSKTWRELSVWHQRSLTRHWTEWTATRFYNRESPETWGIDAIPWSETNTEAFAGLHADHVLVIFDEASAIPDVIWEVSEGAMTTRGSYWFTFGNPTRNTGRFRRCFGADRRRWQTKQIDSRTCRMTNKDEIAEWEESYGEDSDFFRIRVKGQFPKQATDQFISSSVVSAAQSREHDIHVGVPRILSVDVARFGANKTVASIRQGLKLWPQTKWSGLDTMQVAARVVELMNQHQPSHTLIDETGLGAGVVDRIRQMGYSVIGVNFGDVADDDTLYVNKRVEAWGRTRDWLRTADIPNDPELHDDLIGPTYSFDARQRYRLETKQEMMRRGIASPDCGDSLAISFAYNVSPAPMTRADVMPDEIPDY